MRNRQPAILMSMFFFTAILFNGAHAQSAVGEPIGGVGVGLGKPGTRPFIAVGPEANSRAIGTKGVNGAIAAGGDVTVNNTDTTSTNVSNSPTTVSNSPNNVDVTFTNSETSTNTNSPTTKNGITAGDGVNTVSNTRLNATVSSNSVIVNPQRDMATPAQVAGNAVSNGFTGTSGITMNNMNSGNNVNIQSAITVTPVPTSR